MNVQQMIDDLSKIKDKSIPIFFDCAQCGHANAMTTPIECVVVTSRHGQSDEVTSKT
jgi:hypothetical protein